MSFCFSSEPAKIAWVSGAILSLVLITPSGVLAHAGHGDAFHTGTAATTPEGIAVDAETARRMSIAVKPISPQFLSVGIATTGQIEPLPNQKVEVTSPISGTAVELLVSPGFRVKKGQIVAVLSSPELAQLRVESLEKRAEADGDLQQASSDLRLAKETRDRLNEIASADIQQARTQLAFTKEKYERDRQLAQQGAIPRRQALESELQLTQAKAALTKATSRREVLEAEAQLQRAAAALTVAQSRIRLSSAAYEARLKQLGTRANNNSLVTVTAPISGTVADREIN